MKEQETREMQSEQSDTAMVEIINMHKWFGDFHVLQGIDLTVQKKERIVICGPSGSGKSTLIRCINRLEEHQKGRIIDPCGSGHGVPAFQSFPAPDHRR
jgi:general L-amino acid transport system ATP-binding protein